VLLHQVENPLLMTVNYADQDCMDKVWYWEIAHHTGIMLKHGESSKKIAQRVFSLHWFGVDIAECWIYVVVSPAVLLVTNDIIS
jgi:hypothetical protein